jgi:hypothetical protein
MKRLSRVFLSYIILAVIYLLLGIFLPVNTATAQTYHLSVTEYKVLVFLVNIPTIVVWFAVFYGYGTLESYSRAIRKTSDGKAFSAIAQGLKWLAWGLPIGSIITSVLGGIVHGSPELATPAFIIVHYVPLVVSLFAFTYISKGSRSLMQIIRNRFTSHSIRGLVITFAIISVLFTYFTIENVQGSVQNPFFMPMWLVMITIVIPYLYVWFLGLLAAYEILLYGKRSKGLLYKRPLNYLAYGTGLSIIVTIVLQYLESDTTHLRKITFNALYVGVYMLLILYAVGYGLIALGAKRLKKIEEV